MNTIILKGRLTQEPELKVTPSGKHVCTVSVAVDRRYLGAEKKTDFFSCVFWEKSAEFICKYFHKGQEILLSNGEMQSRSYDDKDGNKRTVWEVVNANIDFCGSKADNSTSTAENKSADFEEADDDDGDIPF